MVDERCAGVSVCGGVVCGCARCDVLGVRGGLFAISVWTSRACSAAVGACMHVCSYAFGGYICRYVGVCVVMY